MKKFFVSTVLFLLLVVNSAIFAGDHGWCYLPDEFEHGIVQYNIYEWKSMNGISWYLAGVACVLVHLDVNVYTIPNLYKTLWYTYPDADHFIEWRTEENNPIASLMISSGWGFALSTLTSLTICGVTVLLDKANPLLRDMFLSGVIIAEIMAIHTWRIHDLGPQETIIWPIWRVAF